MRERRETGVDRIARCNARRAAGTQCPWIAPHSNLLAAVLLLAVSGCGRSNDAKQFHDARNLLIGGKYDQALPALDAYLETNSEGKFRSRAQFLIAKAQLGRGNLKEAKAAFVRTKNLYPQTLEAHKARYKLALVAMLEGRDQDAILQFERMARAPEGPLAPEAGAMARYLNDRIAEDAAVPGDAN